MEMDALQKQLKGIGLACLLLCVAPGAAAQTVTVRRVSMDTTLYASGAAAGVKELVDTYSPQMRQKMSAVVAYTVEEMDRNQPESPLSNLAADALLAIARRHYGMDRVDFSLTNFGGIRADLPKGDITLYDVYSVFPFDNSLVLVDLPGTQVKELFTAFAKGRPEALAGVTFAIDNHTIASLTIDGKPLDENRVYHLATIDFLLDGGDKMTALKQNSGVDYSGITLRDVVLEYMKTFYEHSEPLPSRRDGRVTVNNPQ